MPRLLYGTAWKKEATADLVFKALKAGFRGVDTAAQPRHYNEALVGDGIKEAISKNIVRREDLFVCNPFLLPPCSSLPSHSTIGNVNHMRLADPDQVHTSGWTGRAQHTL